MTNSNKRWLLKASPWMKYVSGLAPSIRMLLLIVSLATGIFTANAQMSLVSPYSGLGFMPVTPGTGAPALPMIAGGTTICVGTSTVLTNTVTGGSWSSANTAVATVNAVTGVVTGVHGGVVVITYTVGISTISTTITVTYPLIGATNVCLGNTLLLTDSTFTGNWSSSNPAVATVVPVSTPSIATGQVTGVSAGTATITYGRTGACTVTQTVTVGANGVADIGGVGALGVCTGSTFVATDATPAGTWSSSVPAVASVNAATGLVSGVAAGTTTLTYSVSGCFKTRPVVVTALSSIASITPATPAVCLGSTAALADSTPLGTWSSADPTKATINTSGIVTGVATGSVVISYAKGGCVRTTSLTVGANTTGAIVGNTNVCLNAPATFTSSPAGGAWSVSNPTVATIGSVSGIVTGIHAGPVIITYAQGGCIKTATISINDSTSVGAISGTASVCQGGTTSLTDAVPGGTWSSSDITKATVNTFGSVTGVAAGTVTITYSRLGCKATTGYTVNALPAAIAGTMNVCAGLTTTLSDITPSGTWTSSNLAMATIGSATGIVTGVATGNTTISYTVGGCVTTATFTVKGPAPISGGNIDCISPSAYLYLSDATLGGSWTSANTLIATINATTGAVTGVAGGVVNMTYTQPSTGCYAIKTVTVNYGPGNISGNFVTCAGATTALSDTATGGVWTSSNPAVATINPVTGILSGVATGGTLVSYTKNGCIKTASISVSTTVNPITGPGSVCAGWATIQLGDATPGGSWGTTSTYMYVDGTGKVTGGSVVTGMVTTGVVNYTVGGCTVSTVVTINPNPVSSTSGLPEVCNGSSITLINTTPGGGTWSSQYPAVAAVNATTGVVTGLSVGAAAVTFTGAGGCFKTFVVSVDDTPHTITGPWTVCAGATTQLGGETGLAGGWITSNSSIASVDTAGNVTGIAVGIATITFARAGGCATFHNMTVLPVPSAIGGATAVCIGGATATVTEATAGGTWSISDITLATLSGTTGTPITVTGHLAGVPIVTYTGANGCIVTKPVTINATAPNAITGSNSVCNASVTQLSDATVGGTWASSSTTKATVNATSGLVTGVATGAFTITYTYLGCYVTYAMTDIANTVASISGSYLVCVADTTTLTDATAGGTWTSNNPAVASIGTSSGLVTGVASGSAIITYTSAAGCMTYFSPLSVMATFPAMTGPNSVCKGLSINMSHSISGGTWSTAFPAVATILSNGVLTGVAAGNTNVSYSVIGCATTPSVMLVTVNPVPNAIGGTAKVCQGSTTNLTESTAGGTWTTSNSLQASISSSLGSPITVTGVSYGVPYISYTLPTGCFVSTTMPVGIPPSAISGPLVCSGSTYTFTDGTPGGAWTIANSTKAIIDGTLGVVSPFITGSVDTVFYTTPGCTAVSYIFTINASPAAITGNFSVCKDSSTTLVDTTSGGVWTSANATLATVGSSTGVVTGWNGGLVNITFTAPNGCTQVQSFYVDPCGHKSGNSGTTTTEATEQIYTLFPNPTGGNINITQSIPVDGAMDVVMLNYVGAKVYSGKADFTGGKTQMNVSVAPGMYLLLLQDSKGLVQTFKVLIEK